MQKIIACAALFVFSSQAMADDRQSSPAELAAAVRSKGAKIGKPSKSTLDSPDFVDVHVKKGYCYAVEIRLSSGAKWQAGRSVNLFVPEWPVNPTTVGPDAAGTTGAVFDPGCAEKTGTASFGLNTNGPEDRVGTGGYVLTVYERKPSAKDHATQREIKKIHEESIRERDANRGKTCSQCAGESSVAHDRKICLERRGMTMGDCGW
jgi:hypothetical protein